MSVLKILDAVGATTKRTEKEQILENNKDTLGLKRAIWLAADPLINFHIRKVMPYKALGGEPLSTAMDFLQNVLSARAVTGRKALEQLRSVMERLAPEDATVIERILDRDLRCGAGIPTFNKVWGKKFLQEWPCLLCAGWDFADRIQYPAYVQLKADGMRVNVVVENGEVSYHSRAGSLIEINNPAIDAVFFKLAGAGPAVVFDGELLCWNEKLTKILPRKEGNGIVNKAIKGTISLEESNRLFFSLWDLINLKDFRGGQGTEPYNLRLANLVGAVAQHPAINIEVLETHTVKNEAEAQKLFRGFVANGKEGAILKNRSHLWADSRSKELVKMKVIAEADLYVVGWQEGTGKYAGLLGALICEDDSGEVRVNVGSGFSDEQRRAYTKNNTVGKVAAVLYNEVITASDGSKSLFLPRFVELRYDKTTADSLG